MGQVAEAPSIVPVKGMDDDPILEIIAHLGAALMQVDINDDPIIVGHLRAAHSLALFAQRHAGLNHA
jgi:hypothetical protein